MEIYGVCIEKWGWIKLDHRLQARSVSIRRHGGFSRGTSYAEWSFQGWPRPQPCGLFGTLASKMHSLEKISLVVCYSVCCWPCLFVCLLAFLLACWLVCFLYVSFFPSSFLSYVNAVVYVCLFIDIHCFSLSVYGLSASLCLYTVCFLCPYLALYAFCILGRKQWFLVKQTHLTYKTPGSTGSFNGFCCQLSLHHLVQLSCAHRRRAGRTPRQRQCDRSWRPDIQPSSQAISTNQSNQATNIIYQYLVDMVYMSCLSFSSPKVRAMWVFNFFGTLLRCNGNQKMCFQNKH